MEGPTFRIPWTPAAATAADGAPLVISLTDFRCDHVRGYASVARDGLALRRSWHRVEGAVALGLWSRPLELRLGSLSAWRSEEDLRRFLRSRAHVGVVRRHRPHMSGRSELWPVERFVPAEAWREAFARL
jgi:hypothetical protein